MKKRKKVFKQELILTENAKLELKRLCESTDWVKVPTLLSQCLEEADSDKQCALLKKAEIALQEESCIKLPSHNIYSCLAVLAELFVACDIKNPSRKIISSIFESLPRDWSSDVLSCVVLNKITKARDILILGGDVQRCDVDMISDVLESFTLGTDVLLCNGHFVLEFLGLCLNKHWKISRSESSPALQTSSMLDCLAIIQAIISFLQKSTTEQNFCNLFDQLAFCRMQAQNIDNGNAVRSRYQTAHETVKPWKDLMIQILVDLCAVLFDDLFIPDCRTTAGMAILVVIKVMCVAENVVSTVGRLLFPYHTDSGNRVYSNFNDPNVVAIFQNYEGIASFSNLCLCHGVLAMIPLEFLVQPSEIILNSQKKSGSLMFDALFPDLCCLLESLKESSKTLLAFRTLTLWANQARQIAISYQCEHSWIKDKLNGTSAIATKLLNYVWTHWDHPVEGVRYQTRIICEQVVKFHLIVAQRDSTKDTFLKDLTTSLLKVSCHVRGKYGPLCCIAAVVGATKMLHWFPNLPYEMFPLMKDRYLVSHVMEFLEKMASTHKKEISAAGEDLKGWMKTWIVPLLYYLHHGCGLMREHLFQHCLPKLFKCCPESLQFLVEYLQDGPKASDLGTLITSLKIARGLGLMNFNKTSHGTVQYKSSFWCGIVPVELMKKALCHLDDQIRLNALGLLCDSPRTTEPVTEIDLQLLQLFIPPNMNNQAPSFRQQAEAHLKKFLMRVREAIRKCTKAIKQERNIKEKQINQHQLALYKEFLVWFCACQFDALFPGASFARRTTALSSLTLIKQIFGLEESNDSATMTFNINDVMMQDNIYILLDCLSDSYESNKTMAYDILFATPPEKLPFQEEKSLLDWLSMIDRLISSPRAVDASTAATLLRLLVEKCSLPLRLKKCENEEDAIALKSECECTPCMQAFRVLNYLISLLTSHCLAASKNLYLTGVQAPMHSVIYCIRAIFGYMSLRSLAGDSQWQNLISSLLSKCLCAADIVAPVVTSSSPEGFMMDDNEEDEDFSQVPQYSVLEESQIRAPAAQILLVCCWRTMKEVALLLGELAENAPIQVVNGRHGLITAKQLGNIGEFFTKVLLTSKHRGAFELAHTGFAKLCAVLWRNTDTDLCQLPEQWLQSLLQDLTSAAPSEALCGTRRSAGVPFFIQAIVTAEPSASGRPCFKQVMIDLLKIASKSTDDFRICDSTLPQVHANNILRALYRETKLGEAVFPFVSDGVVVAINGFQSDSWAVRNSSMLLFSALVTRIFGVKQGKDEHSRRNCMTGREFFSRFPELHSFFLGHLQVACQGIDRDNAIHPSLYPVLVILSRLYPSTMDGADTVLSMAMFVPYVTSCRKSMVIKVRIMSARAVVPLVSDDLLVEVLHKLLLSLPVSSSDELRHNHIHGTLLHIYHLLSAHAVNTTMCNTIKMQIVTDILPQLKYFAWLSTRCNPCALSRSVFLDIVLHFVVDWSWLGPAVSDLSDLAKSGLQSLENCFKSIAIEETITKQEPSIVIGDVFVKRTVAKTFLKACEELPSALTIKSHLVVSRQLPFDVQGFKESLETTVNCLEVIQTLLLSSDYEVRLAVLEFVASHLPSGKNTSCGCKAVFEDDMLDKKEESWVFEELEEKLKSQLCTMAMKVEHDTDCLEKVISSKNMILNFNQCAVCLPHVIRYMALQCHERLVVCGIVFHW
ncbi:tRNA (32-2'-O)-methyltransferase regulator THADA-like isoform X2 [Oculina patagonica]